MAKNVFTTSYSQAEIRAIEDRRAVEEAQMINAAHQAKRAMDWLATHECIFTDRFSWTGEGDLVGQVLAAADLERWRDSK